MNNIYWPDQLDDFGRALLEGLGESPHYLPTGYNPITRALRQPVSYTQIGKERTYHEGFLAIAKQIKGFSRVAVCRVATICQMAVFDAERGPEGDGKPKALRRHWYSWFKTEFAQPFSQQLDEDLQSERWGLNWSGRLSQVYAAFVNGGEITYRDLWVEDASRMMESTYERLFADCHIILAVEKDSLFGDFVAPAKALGARSIYSGKGKSSKAAIERVLRDHFSWYSGTGPFTQENPLIILHISDHDFDGESVIGPTFAAQANRYSDHILEARVGIKPETVIELGHDPTEKWYQVKVSNSGYVKWAEEKAMFLAECRECGHKWPVVGTKYYGPGHFLEERHCCSECGEPANYIIPGKDGDPAHGFEVEALKTRDYYGLIVDALLQVLPFDYIVSKLRDECTASADGAARTVAGDVLNGNADYQKILGEFERLEAIKAEFENKVRDALAEEGRPHTHRWRDDDPDPEPDDYRNHVQDATDWAGPWRPFDRTDRTASLTQWLRIERREMIEEFKQERIL